jgi:glycosyltransferase involved in cell wall biosynthesis
VYICSFAADEPYREVVEAMRGLADVAELRITGDHRKADAAVVRGAPGNVTFTGYLPDLDYEHLLRSSDFAMVLTSSAHVLVCGGYEALGAGRPVILSDQDVLRRYYTKGAVFVSNDRRSISEGIRRLVERKPELEREIGQLRVEREEDWTRQFEQVQRAALGEGTGA